MLRRRQFFNFPFATTRTKLTWVYRPLVSVILPVYNQSGFITKSISSVLANDNYPLELIIVDDGSTDEIKTAVKPFLADSRVTVLHEPHRGLCETLNRGFSAAKGRFLTWTSADNRYHSRAIGMLADYLIANPSIGLVYANVELIDRDGKPLKNSSYRPQNQQTDASHKLLLPLSADLLADFGDNFVNACFLYRRCIRDMVGEYDSRLLGHEDYDYWLRASVAAPLSHIDTDETLYLYCLHEDSLTAQLEANALAEKAKETAFEAKAHLEHFRMPLEIALCYNRSTEAHQMQALISASLEASGNRCRASTATKSQDENESLLAITEITAHAKGASSTENSQLSAYAFRPLNFSTKLCFSHSSHESLLVNKEILPFVVSKFSPLKFLGANARLSPHAWMLPPFKLPNSLRMAREGNFKAVTPTKSSRATVLIFMPDKISQGSSNQGGLLSSSMEDYCWKMSVLRLVISSIKDFTFVALCNNELQRMAADDLNLSLIESKSNSNLRIIDLSSQNENRDLVEKSTMYVLSSCETVLNVSSTLTEMSAIIELRVEAAIAALAGIGIIALTRETPESMTTNLASWISSSTPSPSAKVPQSEIPNIALDMPHLSVLKCPDLGSSLVSFLSSALKKALIAATSQDIDQKSLEQFLSTLTLLAMGQRIYSVLLAKEHCAG